MRRSAAVRHQLGFVPRVDVGGLLTGSTPSRRRESLQSLSSALVTGPGYMVLDNMPAGLREADLGEIYKFSRAAHALPVDTKRRFVRDLGISADSSMQGATYIGADAGAIEQSYDGTSVASACSWDFSRVRVGSDTMNAPPMGPDWDFVGVLDSLYSRQNEVAVALLQGIAEALGEPRDAFSNFFENGDMGTIRLLFYPGSDDEQTASADTGIAPHTDFEAFTLMHQTAPGLQFLTPQAAWLDAPVGAQCVIIGDVLERFTNGVLHATPHRVVRMPQPRMSIIRFNAVSPETLIEPLLAFVSDERPCAYSAVTMQEHMDTTLRNLAKGLGSWDPIRLKSTSATYQY